MLSARIAEDLPSNSARQFSAAGDLACELSPWAETLC
jgi:hypothetical protein